MFDLGGVKYTITADTAAMLKAEAVIDKSIGNQVRAFAKADEAVRDFEKTQKQLGRTINSMGQVMSANGKVVAEASVRYRKLAGEAQSSYSTIETQATKASRAVNRALNQSLTNSSYQIQDIAVQLAGGQNLTLVLAQQLPQLLVGLGAAAAGIGAVIAVLGGLYLAFGDSKTAAEKMEKAIEQVKAVMTVGADGVANYTEELRKLERVSEVIAAAKVDAAIVAQKTALAEGVKSMEESFRSFGSFYDERAAKIAENTKLPIKAINELEKAMKFPSTGDPAERVKLFEAAIESLRDGLPDANKKGKELFTSVVDLVSEFAQGSERLQKLNKAVNDAGVSFGNTNKKASELTLELITQKIALEDGDRAALAFKLQMDGLTEAQKQQVLALYDANVATEQSIEKSERASQALEDEIDGWIKVGEEAERAAERKEKAAARELETLKKRGREVGLTDVQSIQLKYEDDLKALQAYLGKDYELKSEYAEREKELQRQKQEAVLESQLKSNKFLQDAFGNLDTQIAGTFAQVAVGAKDGEDAMRSLASTMLTQVIGAAVQYGIELVKNKVLGQTLAASEQANIAATTATGVASQQAATASTVAAAATTATAAAPAAALTSTFSFGSAALIGGAALLGTLAISKMMASGAREYGGPVTNGKSYLVGERGPEIFTPHVSGGITSNKDMMGGGGGMTVNISNNTPYKVFVTKDEAANIANIQIGREAGNLAKGRGKMAGAMKQSAGTRFNATN